MYVLDHDRQISLIREMTQLRKDPESWEVYYHHPTTNAMWKSYFPKSRTNKRGPKILRTEPVPDDLKDRLEECLIEPVQENAMGLGIELSTCPEKWESVINILEKNHRSYPRKQLKLFLEHLGVEDYKILFDELNYDSNNKDIDVSKLNALARRSKIIRYKRFWFF